MTATRLATLADIPALLALGDAFVRSSSYAAFFWMDQPSTQALAQQLITQPNAAIFVSTQGDRLTGMLGLLVYPHFISGALTAGEVFWYVDPDARGQGVRLLREAERWARARGAVQMQMIAPDARVGQLYTRFGYAPVEQTYQRRL